MQGGAVGHARGATRVMQGHAWRAMRDRGELRHDLGVRMLGRHMRARTYERVYTQLHINEL